jgi:hypothetical protein
MKTNFKKLALAAGVTVGMAGVSIPAHAIMVGDPGEAALVPLAVHANGYLNTVVKITVPKSVGNDVISNFYTALNSSPTNGAWNNPGSEAPGDANLVVGSPTLASNCSGAAGATTNSCVHWYWLDETSVHRANGQIPVSQDDVAVFDWRAVSGGNFASQLGYLVFVTEEANYGRAANFSFFTDAWLVVGAAANANVKVSIPSLPMSDGADTTDEPTLSNNVVEYNTSGQLVVRASPLVTGMRTIWSDGRPNVYVFDLPLANNYQVPGWNAGTIAVVWNDRNAGWTGQAQVGPWRDIPAFRFNNNEAKCSGRIPLPEEVNLIYIPRELAAGSPAIVGPSETWADLFKTWWGGFVPPAQETGNGPIPGVWGTLGVVDPYSSTETASGVDSAQFVATRRICTVPVNDGANNAPLPATNLPATVFNNVQLSGGFVKVVAPEPADNNLNTVEGAAVMFTIPIHADGIWAGWPLFLGDSLLGHPAGAFTNAPN